jgi:hypothetical protein
MAAEREAIIKETNANQPNADAEWEDRRKRMAGRREEMAAIREKVDADWRAWREKMDASLKETVAELEPKNDEETLAYREATEARQEEKKQTSLDRKPEAAEERQVPVFILFLSCHCCTVARPSACQSSSVPILTLGPFLHLAAAIRGQFSFLAPFFLGSPTGITSAIVCLTASNFKPLIQGDRKVAHITLSNYNILLV